MKLPEFKLSPNMLALLLALHFTVFLNISMIRELYDIFLNLDGASIPFIVSVFFFFVACFNIIFVPFTIKYFEKPFFIILVLASSLVSFAMYHYRIIFNTDMMTNIFETSPEEAGSYINWSLFAWIGITGILPCLLLLRTKIQHRKIHIDVAFKIISIAVSIAVIGLIATFYYKDYASVIRNNSSLRKDIVPTYFIRSTQQYIGDRYFNAPRVYTKLGVDADRNLPEKPELMVFIVGETARAQNYELNGYNRPTNAYSKNIPNLISFQNATSCGTATAVSLPCMFSMMDRTDYSRSDFDSQDNVIDIMNRADVNMVWEENNTGCKDTCRNISEISIPREKSQYCDGSVCTDDVLLSDLQNKIDDMKDTGGIIFFHIMGSHGPTYYKRTPDKFKKFKPECDKSDIQNCTDEEIINTYDDTILFTDYVMAETIKILQSNDADLNTSMMYMSDHGESLGENGLYLHGMPYSISPSTQTSVPFITWMSDNTIADKNIDMDCLKDKATNDNISHDNLAHILLGYMDINTSALNKDMDIIGQCRQ